MSNLFGSPPSQIYNCRIAVKGEGTGPGNSYVHYLAAMALAAIKNDNLITARTARHARRILFTRSLDKDLGLPPDARFILRFADRVHHSKQTLVTFLPHSLRNLVRHRRGGRVLARRV